MGDLRKEGNGEEGVEPINKIALLYSKCWNIRKRKKN
jgi:hypothetical protein